MQGKRRIWILDKILHEPNELESKCAEKKGVVIELSNWKDGIAIHWGGYDRYRSRFGVRVDNNFSIRYIVFVMTTGIQVAMQSR